MYTCWTQGRRRTAEGTDVEFTRNRRLFFPTPRPCLVFPELFRSALWPHDSTCACKAGPDVDCRLFFDTGRLLSSFLDCA
ncbi:hypothetical protein TGRH88_041580 [Toxoplasma gondii]|uniref:Uncharacterized protein n=1 Tax=Toxoplasma gondii TaxID=5811 RepID=A0A7J6JYI3_TOXGO|nr:hypothetical protein TGRH88_041580 [Toxoplasma gondii]